MDTLLSGGLVVTMDPDADGATGALGIIDDGAVGWTDGELAFVGPAADADPTAAGTVVDAGGAAVLPGLVNAHVHGRHTVLRGGAQDVPEIEWMNDALGPIAAHATDADGTVGCRLAAVETLASGVTTVCEYAERVADLVADVYRPLGLRVAATETITAVADDPDVGPDEPYPFDPDAGRAALERAEALFDAYAADPAVEPMYGPQALDMVPRDLLAEIESRSRREDRAVHMHVAQGDRERRQIEARYGAGATTVGVLGDLGLVSDRLLAAHLHGATPDARVRLANAGVRMVGCPSSIAAIDGIVPPLAGYRDAGGVAGIGTDQAPGPGGHDLRREFRTAAMLAKTDAADPTALTAPDALRLATIGGARALGLADRVGSLTPGKRADVAVFDLEAAGVAPTVAEPFHTAIPNLAYAGAAAPIRAVFVDGERLVDADGVRGVDAEALVTDATRRAERIFADAESDWRAAGSRLVADADAGRL